MKTAITPEYKPIVPFLGSNSNIPITLKTMKPLTTTAIEKPSRQLKLGPGGRQGKMKGLGDYIKDAILLHQNGQYAQDRTDDLRLGCFISRLQCCCVCGNTKCVVAHSS